MTTPGDDQWGRMAALDQEEHKLWELREKLNEPEPLRVDPDELPPVSSGATAPSASPGTAGPAVPAPTTTTKNVGAAPEVLAVLEQLVELPRLHDQPTSRATWHRAKSSLNYCSPRRRSRHLTEVHLHQLLK